MGAAGGNAGLLLMVLIFAVLALVIVLKATGYRTYTVSTNSNGAENIPPERF